MQEIFTKNGLALEAKFIKWGEKGKLFFLQDRLVITNFNNQELSSLDVIEFTAKLI